MFKKIFILLIISLSSNVGTTQQLPVECPAKPMDEDSATALARTWFKKGAKLVDEEQYQKALEAFNCSLKMVEHPGTVFNAAQAAHLARNREAAIVMFGQYLKMDPEGSMVPRANELLEELNLEVEEEKRRQREEKKRRQEQEATRLAALEELEKQEINEAVQEPSDTTTVKTGEDEGRSPLKISGYVSLGIGGSLLISGAVLQGLAGKTGTDGEITDDYQGEWKDLKNKIKGYQTGALVGFVAGGLAAGVGVVLVILDRREDAGPEVSLLPSPTGFTFSGRF
ncbi:MAG: tetratricopeptide repeat protein [Proteobacteria bacterium]|nr:tetratricopeptide repeat protein [Pseudomonadota bacterium]